MNAKNTNRFMVIFIIVVVLSFNTSCDKNKCYSQYLTERYGYKRGSEIIAFNKHYENLIEKDNRDTIATLLSNGYVYNGKAIIKVESSNTDPEFIDRVKKLGGYSYCY